MHIISWIQCQELRDKPQKTHFLPNLYERQTYAIEVNNIETEKFFPSVTVDLNYNSSEFEAFAQGILN